MSNVLMHNLEVSVTSRGLQPTEGPVWLRVGTLFDGLCNAPLQDAHLVYDSKRILYVGARDEPPLREFVRPGQTTPDFVLPNHTILPGLIEAHAHLFLEGGEEDSQKRMEYLQVSKEQFLERAIPRLKRLLQIGVIGVRDAGDKYGVGLALQRQCRERSSLASMPYVDSPGAAIYHQGRYGSFMGGALEEYDSFEACVAARVADGAYRIKLLATGIINFEKGAVTAKPQLPLAELEKLVAAARKHGCQTFAHASGNDGIANCIGAGVDSIEHGFFLDEDQLAMMRDKNIAWVPTFAPVQFQVDKAAQLGWSDTVKSNLLRILESHARALMKAHSMGVCVLAGSDAGSHGVAHGWGLLWELELMERAGMSSLQVIRAATGSSALRLGYRQPFGIIRPGALSRFILTEHSPFQTVRNLRKPKIVFFDGEVFDEGDQPQQPGL
jgi:imidazolonepropionase-like amidohydrolase